MKNRQHQLLSFLVASHNLHCPLTHISDKVEQNRVREGIQPGDFSKINLERKYICFLSINHQLLNQHNFNRLWDVFRYILNLNPKRGR